MKDSEVSPRPEGRTSLNRAYWIGAVLIGLVGVGVAVFFQAVILRSALERARSAYKSGDFPDAIDLSNRWLASHPGHTEAIRTKAQSLAKLGRGGEAVALFQGLGGESLLAEDLVLTGNELLVSDRRVLALAAFHAATKLGDPDQRRGGTSTAIKPPAAATGNLTEIKQSERLAVVPSGAGLAELVLAIAVADNPARRTPPSPSFLSRVLRLDRASLQSIDGPPAARKLIARMELEDGRVAEAKSWLSRGPNLDHDPEAKWLLSRALLTEGNLDGAVAASVESHGFGTDDLTRPEPAPYVGAKRCSACHSAIFESHQKTGHAETFATGEAMASVPLPSKPVRDPGNPDVEHTFERTGREVRLETSVKGQILRAVLDYALGSGRHGMTMLGRPESGRRRMLRLSYYSTGGEHWDLTNGLEKRPEEVEAYLGPPVEGESFIKCLNCHTTRFTSDRERTGPEAADRGIGCERCHGPADHHLRAVELGFPDPAIARPKSATPAQRLKVCAQCHGSDGVIPPSDPRFVRFQAANLPFSRCFTESGSKLDCVACHDPHSGLKTDHHYYEIRCLACHGGAASKQHAGLRFDTVASKPCPVNPKDGCITCHMPKAKEVMPFTDFTDHHIRVHRGPNETKPPVMNP